VRWSKHRHERSDTWTSCSATPSSPYIRKMSAMSHCSWPWQTRSFFASTVRTLSAEEQELQKDLWSRFFAANKDHNSPFSMKVMRSSSMCHRGSKNFIDQLVHQVRGGHQ
jgi:hypothetical protein